LPGAGVHRGDHQITIGRGLLVQTASSRWGGRRFTSDEDSFSAHILGVVVIGERKERSAGKGKKGLAHKLRRGGRGGDEAKGRKGGKTDETSSKQTHNREGQSGKKKG